MASKGYISDRLLKRQAKQIFVITCVSLQFVLNKPVSASMLLEVQ